MRLRRLPLERGASDRQSRIRGSRSCPLRADCAGLREPL